MARTPRSVLRPKVAPPDVYLIPPTDAAKALGVSKASLARWRQEWKTLGTSAGPEPVYLTPRIVKYRVDECHNFGTTFVDRMKAIAAATVSPVAKAANS